MKSVGLIHLLLLLFLLSCNESSQVREAIRQAGDNRYELEKVLRYYEVSPADSLKLKAARFLIGNMQNKKFLEGGEMVLYRIAFDSISQRHDLGWDNDNREIAAIVKWAKRRQIDTKMTVVQDARRITGEELIENIEIAFRAWEKMPWHKQLSFDQFCEYVLPYRFTNEQLESCWRRKLFERNEELWTQAADSGWSSIEVCKRLNKQIKVAFISNFDGCPGDMNFLDIERTKRGRCIEQCNFALMNMRAIGLPVGLEMVPVWANRDFGHTWNCVFDSTGKSIDFLGTEHAPGEHQLVYIPSKIYRKQFSIQRDTPLYKYRETEYIPPFFSLHDRIDVTKQYDMPLTSLSVPTLGHEGKCHIAYLCTFSNEEWHPVAYTEIKEGKARFDNLGRGYIPGSHERFADYGKGVLYLPVVYTGEESTMTPLGNPVLIFRDGSRHEVKPNINRFQELVIRRKYPRTKNTITNARMMRGGRFDAAIDRQFTTAVRLHTIDYLPESRMQRVTPNSQVACRYIRYVPPTDSWKEIGEIGFIDPNGNSLPARIISAHKDTAHLKNICDGNLLSYYNSPPEEREEFVFDFGKVTPVSAIDFCPRTDDNDITPGYRYELFMWGGNEWVSLGTQQATAYTITFGKVPANGLYLIKNLDKGREHRPFTYVDGKQIWW